LLVIAYVIVRNLRKSRVGRSLVAVRDNETAAAVMGVNLAITKTVTFGVSAAIAGASGWLTAGRLSTMDENSFTILNSIRYLLALFLGGAATAADQDVAAGQTAAAIENLAIAVYGTAAKLPFMQDIPDPAGTTVVSFVKSTVAQHQDHAKAFNAAVTKLGGKEQTKIDQVAYDELVKPALPTLKAPVDVVKFAATLELIAAETYAAETASADDKNLRNTLSSIMGVENQHRSILLAVQALLEAGAPELIEVPPDLSKLPAAAGSVGFPDAFLPLDQARPADEGAVK
jgi:hypothetical protein